MKKVICIYVGCLFGSFSFSNAANVLVPTNVNWVKQDNSIPVGKFIQVYNQLKVNLLASDSLTILGPNRNSIRFDDLQGNLNSPIVITNGNHQIIVEQPSNGNVGIAFNNCAYVKLSGSGNPNIKYGIKVQNIPFGSGISVNNYSTDFEIEGVEITKIFSSGIVAKTDPNCANLSTYNSFVMQGLSFHDNYIHHIGNEGFYIGHTGYNEGKGINVNCSGVNNKVLPHTISNVRVYNNILDSCGWDAIQVSATQNFSIFNNYIVNDSWADYPNQLSGIMIGQPSVGKVFNNTILNGYGPGVFCFGVGVSIYNNLIVNPSRSPKYRGSFNSSGQFTGTVFSYGIYINDKVCVSNLVTPLPYLVAHNTIIINKTYPLGAPYYTYAPQGININSLNYTTGSTVGNNLVVIDTNYTTAPVTLVNGIFSSNSVPNYPISNNPQFVSSNARSNNIGNYCSNEINAIAFNNYGSYNFGLNQNSAAINSANVSLVQNNQFLQQDLFQNIRPEGSAPDFGCIEATINISLNNSRNLTIWPNPYIHSSGNLSVQANNIASYNSITIKVISLINPSNAVFVYSNNANTLPANNGSITANFNMPALLPGIYNVQVFINENYFSATNLVAN